MSMINNLSNKKGIVITLVLLSLFTVSIPILSFFVSAIALFIVFKSKAFSNTVRIIMLVVVCLLLIVGLILSIQYISNPEKYKADIKAKWVADSIDRFKKESADSIDRFKKDSIALFEKALKDKYINSKEYQDSILKIDKENNPLNYLSADISWQTGGFGLVALGKITIKNDGIKEAYDIKVEIEFMGESGTTVTTKTKLLTIVVLPNKSKTTNEINFGYINEQAQTARIKIIDSQFR